MTPNTEFRSGVISYNFQYWTDAHKRYCDISGKTVSLQIPFDKVDTVSFQFYYTIKENNGSRLYISNILHLFGYYNDKSVVTDAGCIPSNATTYNNAQLNNGDWGVTRTPVTCKYLGSPVWSYISMVCKQNADSTWQIYLYLNSTLYYSWTKSSLSNNFVLSTGDTQCNIYLMEFMVYTVNKAADDFSAYLNNNSYKPMY